MPSFRVAPRIWLAAVLVLAAGSCTAIQPARVTQFVQAVDAAHQQTQTTFREMNALVTEDEITRVVDLDRLRESDVAPVLKPDDIAKWDKAFALVDDYCANLLKLISGDAASDFEKSVTEFAGTLGKVDAAALPSPRVATGFAELGRLLINAKAQRDARRIAQAVDPAIQQVFAEMASAVGAPGEAGLFTTTQAHWTDRLDGKDQEFRNKHKEINPAKTREEQSAVRAEKKGLVVEYIQLRDERDAQLLSLAALRRSFRSLAEAHSGLARGNTADLSTALTMIETELDSTKSIYTTLKATDGSKGPGR